MTMLKPQTLTRDDNKTRIGGAVRVGNFRVLDYADCINHAVVRAKINHAVCNAGDETTLAPVK